MRSHAAKFGLTVSIQLVALVAALLTRPGARRIAAPIAPRPSLAVEAVNTYVFSHTTTTYTEIAGTTSTATGDDGAENVTLPFTFRYDGAQLHDGSHQHQWLVAGVGGNILHEFGLQQRPCQHEPETFTDTGMG